MCDGHTKVAGRGGVGRFRRRRGMRMGREVPVSGRRHENAFQRLSLAERSDGINRQTRDAADQFGLRLICLVITWSRVTTPQILDNRRDVSTKLSLRSPPLTCDR